MDAPVFLNDLRLAVEDYEAKAAALRKAYDDAVRIVGGAAALTTSAAPATERRSPVTGGSIEDRILSAVKAGATTKPELDAAAKAKPYDVNKTINGLIAAKRLARTGHSRGTRYTLGS